MHVLDAPNVIRLVHKDANVDGLALQPREVVAVRAHRAHCVPRIEELHVLHRGVVALHEHSVGVRHGRLRAQLLGVPHGEAPHGGVLGHCNKGGAALVAAARARAQDGAIDGRRAVLAHIVAGHGFKRAHQRNAPCQANARGARGAAGHRGGKGKLPRGHIHHAAAARGGSAQRRNRRRKGGGVVGDPVAHGAKVGDHGNAGRWASTQHVRRAQHAPREAARGGGKRGPSSGGGEEGKEQAGQHSELSLPTWDGCICAPQQRTPATVTHFQKPKGSSKTRPTPHFAAQWTPRPPLPHPLTQQQSSLQLPSPAFLQRLYTRPQRPRPRPRSRRLRPLAP